MIWRGTCFSFPWLFSSLFCFYIYLVLIIGLNQRFELPTTHHSILLSVFCSLHQNILRDWIRGLRWAIASVTSPPDDDFSSNSHNANVGGRSRNTSFDSTSNGNGRIKRHDSIPRTILKLRGRQQRQGRRKEVELTEHSPTNDQ